MKVLIWILCLFIPSAIQIFEAKSGNGLGAIPVIILYSIFLGIAKLLCDKWTDYQCGRADKALQVARERYIASNISPDIVAKCESYKDNKVALKTYLQSIETDGVITQEQSDHLYRHFTEQKLN